MYRTRARQGAGGGFVAAGSDSVRGRGHAYTGGSMHAYTGGGELTRAGASLHVRGHAYTCGGRLTWAGACLHGAGACLHGRGPSQGGGMLTRGAVQSQGPGSTVY